MKKTFQTQDTFELLESHKETNSGEILVEQKQAMSIEDILRRFQQGENIPSGDALYADDPENFDQDDIIKEVTADLVDRGNKKQSVKDKISKLEALEAERKKAVAEATQKSNEGGTTETA